MLVRLVHFQKAPTPMLVTLSGIVMLVRLVQSAKAPPPMVVTPSPIVMLVRLVQSWKAASPILVTGLPSILAGMIRSPDAFSSQLVIVTVSPSISYFQLGLTDTASGGLASEAVSLREPSEGASEAASSGESLEGAMLLFSPSHPMRKLKAKSEIKCFMLITNY